MVELGTVKVNYDLEARGKCEPRSNHEQAELDT